MSKHALTISPDYCPNWTVVDAVRELFQNALDQQVTMEDNEMFFKYDGENNLMIGNKKSVLSVGSLLLGTSTKRNDDKTIGKFGEGYKIATLVLLRLGKVVTFYNYGAKEVWRPRFVDSRVYKSKVLTFFVDKILTPSFVKALPDHNLTITVEGVTPEEYELIVKSNLHLQDVGLVVETPFGRVLEDDKFAGNVYVNGLFVCKYEPYKCGYDFKPAHINIDRDRKLMSDWDLTYLSSRMWGTIQSPKIAELAAINAADVKHVSWNMPDNSKAMTVYDTAHENFVAKHGCMAVPVTSQEEMTGLAESATPVIVSESYQALIKRSSNYEAPAKKVIVPRTSVTIERLNTWFDKVSASLDTEIVEEFYEIIEHMQKIFDESEDGKMPF